jgi:hypothetical protein
MPDVHRDLNADPTDSASDPRDDLVNARLLTDGAIWRDSLPTTATLLDRVQQLAAQAPAVAPTTREREDTRVSQQPRPTLNVRQPTPPNIPPRPRWTGAKGVIAAVAALAVVALFVVLLHGSHPTTTGPGPGPAASTTSHGTPTAAPHNIWTQPPALASLDSAPIMAAGDPQVIYLGGAHLRRSDDFGAHWKTLPLPADFPANNGYTWVDVFVSPASPDTIFATANLQVGATCPTLAKQSGHIGAQAHLGGSVPCDLQWVSQDGGQNWQPVQVGVSGELLGSATADRYAGISYSAPPQQQGNTLFSLAGYGPEAAFPGYRIVKSADGGHTWSPVDSQLVNAGLQTCDYAADSASHALYAIVTTGNCSWDAPPQIALWASTDSGAHWSQVTLPRQGLAENMLVNGGTLYLALAIANNQAHVGGGSLGATGFFASRDGGHTWQASPATGIPAGNIAPFATISAYATGLLVPFSDSSSTAPTSGPLYTWSYGANRWNLVATAPVNSVLYVLPYQRTPGDNPILWLAYQGYANNAPTYGLIEYVP